MIEETTLFRNLVVLLAVSSMIGMAVVMLRFIQQSPAHYYNLLPVSRETDFDRDGIADYYDDSDGDGISDDQDPDTLPTLLRISRNRSFQELQQQLDDEINGHQ